MEDEIEKKIDEYLKSGTVLLSRDEAKNEKYFDFLRQIYKCTKCFKNKLVLPGTGYLDSKIVFIGESPSKRRTYHLTFGEKSRKIFERILSMMNMKREDVWATNVVKCIVPHVTAGLWEYCVSFLEIELKIIKPEFIIALGLIPRKALELIKPKCNVFYLKHPMYYVYSPNMIAELVLYTSQIVKALSRKNLLSYGETNARSTS